MITFHVTSGWINSEIGYIWIDYLSFKMVMVPPFFLDRASKDLIEFYDWEYIWVVTDFHAAMV